MSESQLFRGFSLAHFARLGKSLSLIELRFCYIYSLYVYIYELETITGPTVAPFRNDYPELALTGEKRNATFAKVGAGYLA